MTNRQEPSEGRESFGLWQIIDMSTDPAMPRGEIELRSTEGSERADFFARVTRSMEHWRSLRENARYEQALREPQPARRFLEQLQRAGQLPAGDPLVLDIETQCQMPPPSAFDQVTIPAGNWMSYDALRDLIGGAVTDIREQDERSRLLQRVEAARREVAIMNIALDNDADPCQCGSWEVTWSVALDRWICNVCADSEAEDLHEEDDARTGEQRGMQGHSTHLAVYDELARYVRNDAAETARMLAEAVAGPVEMPQPRNLSREQFVASYWRSGLSIVSPQDAIRLPPMPSSAPVARVHE